MKYGATLIGEDYLPFPTVKHRGGRTYHVVEAGKSFFVELEGPNGKMKGAIVQIDGQPADWKSLPFVYFRSASFILKGSWTDPMKGEMKGWTFGTPAKSDTPTAAADNVGVIKVYFYDNLAKIVRSGMSGKKYTYDTPEIPSDTKPRDASLSVVYGKKHHMPTMDKWSYKIIDADKPVKVITLFYASAAQLQIMGHKPGTKSFSTPSPSKKRRIEKNDDDGVGDDTVEEVAAPEKPAPEVITVDD